MKHRIGANRTSQTTIRFRATGRTTFGKRFVRRHQYSVPEVHIWEARSFTVDAKVKGYFCDPQSPWQCGTNENTNGVLRHYIPKRTDLSGYSQAELDEVALRLNQRPRKLWDLKLQPIDCKQVLH
jgi:hypothetical protein